MAAECQRCYLSPRRSLKRRPCGGFFAGYDPRESPSVTALFPTGEPVARAKFGSLQPVLVAASDDDTRKCFSAVFFQLCKNLAVGTNGHVLHTSRSTARTGATS